MVLRNRNTAFWLELLIKAKYQEKKMEPKVGAGVISNAPSRIRQKKAPQHCPWPPEVVTLVSWCRVPYLVEGMADVAQIFTDHLLAQPFPGDEESGHRRRGVVQKSLNKISCEPGSDVDKYPVSGYAL